LKFGKVEVAVSGFFTYSSEDITLGMCKTYDGYAIALWRWEIVVAGKYKVAARDTGVQDVRF